MNNLEVKKMKDYNVEAMLDELIEEINNSGRKIDMEILQEIVRTDNKQRYSFIK